MKNLYVLLVGINDYAPPLSSLNGCIKDVERIEQYIINHYEKDYTLHIKKLIDAEATYQNIINGFRSHLCKAKADDVAWFHYSGHGSEEASAPEFLELDPSGKDQTLICFDSRNGSDHLADKELAVLIKEVNTIDESGKPKDSPHVVVSLDCCHSGSGTRDAMSEVVGVRNADSSGQKRTLDSYVDGFYARQGGRLQIPSSSHVLLAGCESIQTAGDMLRGGCFTQSLIDELEDANGHINYADLHLRAKRNVIRLRGSKQTPQFETLNNFNPYTKFLDGSPLGNPDVFDVEEDNGTWYVNAGAIHGIPTQSDVPIEIELLKGNEQLGKAELLSVGAQKSQIKFNLSNTDGFAKPLSKDENNFKAFLLHLPASKEMVRIEGDLELTNTLKNKAAQGNFLFLLDNEAAEQARFLLTVTPNAIQIEDTALQQVKWQQNSSSDQVLAIALKTLDEMVKWKRMISLSNNDKTSQLSNLVNFSIEVFSADGKNEEYHLPEIELFAGKSNSQNGIMGFQPKVRFKAQNQNLHFYLFHLRTNYSILCNDGEVIYRPDEHATNGEIVLPLWKQIMGWGLSENDNSAVSYFKLLVTSEPLMYQELEQIGIVKTRDVEVGAWNAAPKISNDWHCETICVRMIRENDTINSERGVSLLNGNVRIRPHKGIRAGVGFGNAFRNERSAAAGGALFAELQSPMLKLTSLNNERDHQAQNLLELNNIEIDSGIDLLENPLEIELNENLAEGEVLMPITFDGQHYQIIGQAENSGEQTLVTINEIPQNNTGERSIIHSLKLAFVKLVLKKEENINKLNAVHINNDGSFSKSESGIGKKVREANRILLLTHGLFGNTNTLLQQLAQNKHSVFNNFDLVLTYDYESLNTPLDKSARLLLNSLSDVGINENKKITFMGHSTGALMLRWLVEKEGGNRFTEKMFLLGAPNNGSALGNIEHVRKYTSTVLSLAINFIPNLVPFSGILLKSLKNIGELSVTLGQTKKDSPFLKSLNNSSSPGVPYFIIGGDVNAYKEQGGTLHSFIEKALLKLGNVFNTNEKHDLFATLNSMENMVNWSDWNPKPKMVETLKCYHYNYLSEGLTENSLAID